VLALVTLSVLSCMCLLAIIDDRESHVVVCVELHVDVAH
jgi:hypothetical protein